MRTLAKVIVLVLLAVAIGAGAWMYTMHKAAHSPVDASATEKVIFSVPKGASLSRIGRMLHKEKLINNATAWRIYLRINPGAAVKAGRHELTRAMTVPQIVAALAKRPLSEDVPLAMVEGWRLVDADEWLTDNGWIDRGAYLKAASDPSRFKVPFNVKIKTLEGFLLPDTYAVPKGKLDVNKLIQRQIDAFNVRFVQAYKDEIGGSKRTLHQLTIVASMLEREERKPRNRPTVAGIMYKRFDKNTPLGIDATSRYPLSDWSDRRKFLARLRDPDDPYNTRLKAGLPPTPIGAPSLDALLAALRPVKTRNWYYLHDHDGNIHYAVDGAGHEQNRRKYNVR